MSQSLAVSIGSSSRTLFGFLATLLLFGTVPVGPSSSASASARIEPEDPFAAKLMASGSSDLLRRWERALQLESDAVDISERDPERARPLFLEAAALFDDLGAESEGSGAPYWQSARCHWLLAEMLPVENKKDRLAHFTIADERAAKGIEVDPTCGECMLWKFTAMGRLRTTQGVIAGLRGVSVMADLLDRGIELKPTHRDGDDNSTMGNLHYGSAIFYRVLPDWTWLGWILGVRGDKERALGHAREALALHPERLDYRLEVGSQLLCIGSSRRTSEPIAEGARVLQRVLATPVSGVRDERQLAAARIMLEDPGKSCGYTGDTWVEIDATEAAASVSAR